MACRNLGPIGHQIRLTVDEDGHRTYVVPFLVQGASSADGPYTALNTTGLPRPGSTYRDLFSSDDDPCAWCRPTREVVPHRPPDQREGTAPEFWIVSCTFSTKHQQEGKERCADDTICDPMDEPQKISIDYSRFTEEASYDRYGRRILSSSHEPIHGPNNEWEFTRTTVTIEQNVVDPQLDLIEQIKDTVNVISLWGFPPRTIKFTPISVSRRFRNLENLVGTGPGECEAFWTRRLSFEIKYRRREGALGLPGTGTGVELTPVPGGPYETWDRNVWDEGTRVLRGYWSDAGSQIGTGTQYTTHWTLTNINGQPPDPNNPQHYIRFKDWNGENTRTLLDGRGRPAYVNIIQNEWWVIKETFNDTYGGETTFSATYHVMNLPCWSARKQVEFLQDADMFAVSVELFGPFASESAANAAIPSGLGSAVTTCPDEPASVGVIRIEKYGQSDFTLLGIPLDLTLPLPPFTYP